MLLDKRVLFLLIMLPLPVLADGSRLTVATWGGAYEAVLKETLFEPFAEETGVSVETLSYTGGIDVAVGEKPPDIVDMTMSDAMAACSLGLLRQLDHSALPPAADGTPAANDFLPDAMQPCSLTHTLYAVVLAYDSRAFEGIPPSRVEHLFDLEAFPGPRALQATPGGNLEWALLSYGVPRQEIYNLLSTQRGQRLAYRRLDTLRDQVQWWLDGDDPVRLLEQGEVVMASGFNGRFFAAGLSGDSPIQVIWDGQIQEHQTWAIPVNAPESEIAAEFIRFATTTERLTAVAERIAYGPARESASQRVSQHPEGIDMRPHIPTHPYNAATAISKDVEWYANTYQRIRERFEQWLDADAVSQSD